MIIRNNTITCPVDLLGRYAHRLTQKLSDVKSSVYIKRVNVETLINAKSLLGVLSLCTKCNEKIVVSCHNEDESISNSDLEKVIEIIGNLGEE